MTTSRALTSAAEEMLHLKRQSWLNTAVVVCVRRGRSGILLILVCSRFPVQIHLESLCTWELLLETVLRPMVAVNSVIKLTRNLIES